MSRPNIPNLRTWPRNLSTSQNGGLSTSIYGGCQHLSMEEHQHLSMGDCLHLNMVACQHLSMEGYLHLNMVVFRLRSMEVYLRHNMVDFRLLNMVGYLRQKEGECPLPLQISIEVIFHRGLITLESLKQEVMVGHQK